MEEEAYAKPVSDIWFTSDLNLKAIADLLNEGDNSVDGENYWEWIDFSFKGYSLTITRTHRKRPDETDTRIYLPGLRSFPAKLMEEICLKLVALEVGEILLGKWIYVSGNTYDKVVLDKWV